MVTEHEINLLAAYMVDTHGEKAIGFADQAVDELERIGATAKAACCTEAGASSDGASSRLRGREITCLQ